MLTEPASYLTLTQRAVLGMLECILVLSMLSVA
jgi:hypothetical protein